VKRSRVAAAAVLVIALQIEEARGAEVAGVALDDRVAVAGLCYRGQEKGAISGADPSHALLKIWLGAHPGAIDLKQALLGG